MFPQINILVFINVPTRKLHFLYSIKIPQQLLTSILNLLNKHIPVSPNHWNIKITFNSYNTIFLQIITLVPTKVLIKNDNFLITSKSHNSFNFWSSYKTYRMNTSQPLSIVKISHNSLFLDSILSLLNNLIHIFLNAQHNIHLLDACQLKFILDILMLNGHGCEIFTRALIPLFHDLNTPLWF